MTDNALSALISLVHYAMVTDKIRRTGECSAEESADLYNDARSEGLDSFWVNMALHDGSDSFSWYTVGDPYGEETVMLGMTSPRIMPGFWTEDDGRMVEIAPDWAVPSGVHGNPDPGEVRHVAHLIDVTRRALGGAMPRKVTPKRKAFLPIAAE